MAARQRLLQQTQASDRQIYEISDIPAFVDIPFLQRLFAVSATTLRRKCADGKIKAVKIGDTWRIPKSEILRFYNEGGTI